MNPIKNLHALYKSGLTQSKLAEKLEVSQSLISRLLSGERKGVGFDVGQKIITLHRNTFKSKPTLSAHGFEHLCDKYK